MGVTDVFLSWQKVSPRAAIFLNSEARGPNAQGYTFAQPISLKIGKGRFCRTNLMPSLVTAHLILNRLHRPWNWIHFVLPIIWNDHIPVFIKGTELLIVWHLEIAIVLSLWKKHFEKIRTRLIIEPVIMIGTLSISKPTY